MMSLSKKDEYGEEEEEEEDKSFKIWLVIWKVIEQMERRYELGS